MFFSFDTVAQKVYIDAPDGTRIEVPSSTYYDEALTAAKKQFPKSWGLSKISDEKKYNVDYFNECKLKAAKESTIEASLRASIQVCMYQAIPKKCRMHKIEIDRLGNEEGDERVKCVESCTKEGVYSRKFGECSVG